MHVLWDQPFLVHYGSHLSSLPTRWSQCLVEHKKDLIYFKHPGFLVHCGKVGMWCLVGGWVPQRTVGKVRPWCNTKPRNTMFSSY